MARERVATATINTLGELTDGSGKGRGANGTVITEADIQARAWRTCPVGSAACCFSGVECAVIGATGTVEVAMLGAGGVACGADDTRLQQGLDRLRASARAPIVPKA